MALQIAAFLISLTVFCHAEVPETSHPISDQIYGKYIELSMNLTILLKDTAIEEAKIHQLAKDIVSSDKDEEKIQRVLDKFMNNLPEEQKKDFGRLYFDKM
uniref:Secreted protein n=1 Tax=Caenorhabditis tropicalis TaxID=1561998 RepID=A0A1I7T240_9PELO